jgi:uncharacterized peroxidase-related enzyme
MSRLNAIEPATATGKTKDLLDAVKGKFGIVPNMTRVMANSPAVLEGFVHLYGALSSGQLDAKLREQLGLVIAQQNHCNYCLSAHSAIGKMVGLNAEQIAASREAHADTEKVTAALTFATQILDAKGHVTEQDLATVRQAGYSDEEIAEIIGQVALNVFTNYFNVATGVDIDFPKVSYQTIA